MIAADRDDARARLAQVQQPIPHDALRVGQRRRRLEQVARDEHEIDALGGRHIRDLGEDGAVLLEP